VAVLGARQSGKSTLVETVLAERFRTVVFDPVQDVGLARHDPDLFLQNNPGALFLDEIQYAPELLSAVKRAVDRDRRPGRFVLSGSQHLAVVKGMSESLAGRVAFVDLHPFCLRETAGETDRDFLQNWVQNPGVLTGGQVRHANRQWYHTIWRGGFPALLDAPDHLLPSYFDGYFRTYVERDLRRVANVGDLQVFGQFCRLLAGLTGCEINATELGRELGIDRRTALAWKSILASSYQWIEIPPFSRNAVKRVVGKSKGYATDTGLACWLQRIVTPDALPGHPLLGHLIETWVVTEMIKAVQAWHAPPGFYHYRSRGGAEVDLVLELDGRLFPIEIKATSHPSPRDTLGLRSFRNTFPNERIAPGLLVCAVASPQWLSSDVLAFPWWCL
jgi:hypothetical protein